MPRETHAPGPKTHVTPLQRYISTLLTCKVTLEDRLRRGIGTALASAGYLVPSVTIQMFADTIIAYFPWDKENPNALVTMYSLLIATAETVIVALASEIPIRGGLEVHVATEFNERVQKNPANMIVSGGDIWGPAPKRAYELSENNHNYMRICVGDDVLILQRYKCSRKYSWLTDEVFQEPYF